MLTVRKVGIVGGGVMGGNLAALVAREGLQKGFCGIVKEANAELAAKLRRELDARFDSWHAKGKINEGQCANLKALVEVTHEWTNFSDVDFLIEAVTENLELKKKIFAEAEAVLPPHAVMTSNTSAIPIAQLAEALVDPQRLVGLHFFNPPTQIPAVEVIPGKHSLPEWVVEVAEFAKEGLGKKVVLLKKEGPGFIVNRMLVPYFNEAVWLLMESRMTPEALDAVATEFGWPMGPFTLLDAIGIDTAAKVSSTFFRCLGARAAPPPLLNMMVAEKRFGKKNGVGFYGEPSVIELIATKFPSARQAEISPADGFRRMMLGLVNEAFALLDEGIAEAEDVETACLYGIGFPMALSGPLHWAESQGLATIVAELETLEKVYGFRFRPCNLIREYAAQKKPVFSGW